MMTMISTKTMISEEYDDQIIKVDLSKEIRCQNIITYSKWDEESQARRQITRKCNRKLAVGDVGKGGKIEFHCEKCGKKYRIMKIP